MLRSMCLLVFTLVLVKIFFPDLGHTVENLLMRSVETLQSAVDGAQL